MGTELKLQAIPEHSKILDIAKVDGEFDELLSFFSRTARTLELFLGQEDDLSRLFVDHVKNIVQEHPDIGKRYFHGVGRKGDAIIYLLSENRRLRIPSKDTQDLITIASWGSEIISTNRAPQASSIGLVSTEYVHKIAKFMSNITIEQFQQFWDPEKMWEARVYKADSSWDRVTLEHCWEEYQQMNQFYQAVSQENEAVITMLV